MRIPNTLRRRLGLLALGAIVVAALVGGCGQAAPAPSSMEVIHASYLDLTANLADLRSRVTEWQKGDEGSLNIAKEKLERSEIVLGAPGWPQALAPAVAKAKAALGTMDKALQAADVAAAQAATVVLGDASHDLTHAFYGDWLPELEGERYSPLAAHVVYLDLSANLADVQSRLAAWGQGDESSLNIAVEKVERAEVLVNHMYATGVLVKRLPPVQRGLVALFPALQAKDLPAAQAAAQPLAASAQDLTQDAYVWLDLVKAGDDPSSVQASYLDLSRNIAALRSGVAASQKGNHTGLDLARQHLARVQTVLQHAVWPYEMGEAIDRARSAVGPMASALGTGDPAAAEAASVAFGEASHDVTHAYYGNWLATGVLQSATAQGGAAQQPARASSGGHVHDAAPAEQVAAADAGPHWPIIGGFAAALALVVGAAALTKPKAVARETRASLPEAGEA